VFDFKLEDIEDVSFDPLPKGIYSFQVEEAEVKDTKDGEGKYISLKLNVIGGDFADRKIFETFNVVNKNPKTVNIAKSDLKKLIIASGADIEVFTGPDQLLGLEFNAALGIKKGSGDYEDRNEIKKYISASEDIGTEDVPVESSPHQSEGEEAFD